MTMNAIFQNALLLACGTLALAAQETEIHCTDGSRIRGSLLGIGADRVEFGADFLAAPVPLRLDKVLELSLPVHPGDPKGDHVATVTLSNGDVLRGELTGVNETEIRLRTWYAGELTFRRVMVDTLEIQDRPEILYTGPNGLEGWVQETAGSWIFENGSSFTPTRSNRITRPIATSSSAKAATSSSRNAGPRTTARAA
jgi:hypothetical protein